MVLSFCPPPEAEPHSREQEHNREKQEHTCSSDDITFHSTTSLLKISQQLWFPCLSDRLKKYTDDKHDIPSDLASKSLI